MPQEPRNKEVEEHIQSAVEEAKQQVTASRRSWYHGKRIGGILLGLYALQLTLFAVLAWWVHYHPILAIDVAITREFQENPAPWLKITMMVISYPGSTFILPALVILTAIIFWVVDLRLEAIFVIALSAVSEGLNVLLKILVARPRPTPHLVEVFQAATGQSFPSGHVMAYLAYWGLLFSFGIIVFRGKSWWRILLLVVSALFVVLVGPSRIYLGDHWPTDVLGSYLIGGTLLGIALWIYLQLKQRGVLETKGRERE
jgi:membrane-associated phospholipid phosphatase